MALLRPVADPRLRKLHLDVWTRLAILSLGARRRARSRDDDEAAALGSAHVALAAARGDFDAAEHPRTFVNQVWRWGVQTWWRQQARHRHFETPWQVMDRIGAHDDESTDSFGVDERGPLAPAVHPTCPAAADREDPAPGAIELACAALDRSAADPITRLLLIAELNPSDLRIEHIEAAATSSGRVQGARGGGERRDGLLRSAAEAWAILQTSTLPPPATWTARERSEWRGLLAWAFFGDPGVPDRAAWPVADTNRARNRLEARVSRARAAARAEYLAAATRPHQQIVPFAVSSRRRAASNQ